MQLINKIKKVFKNKDLINQKLNNILFKNKGKPIKKIFSKTFSLNDRIKEINYLKYKTVLYVGDGQSFKHVKSNLPGKKIIWANSNFEDFKKGAEPLYELNFSNFDGILISGFNVNENYRFILSKLTGKKNIPEIYWASDNFEFCGGTIPVSKKCKDAEVVIFNHFPIYFGIYDPLLVKIKIISPEVTKILSFIFKPNETKKIKLLDYINKIDETVCILHECSHPRLTNKRHNRWRSTGVYFWKNSRSMVHSDHDFMVSNKTNEFKISLGLVNKGDINITIPNYERNLSKQDLEFTTLENSDFVNNKRDLNKNIEEVNYIKSNFIENDGYFGIDYKGYGGSFWFAFEKSNKKKHENIIFANHSGRSFLNNEKAIYKDFDKSFKDYFQLLTKQNIMLTPFCIPILDNNELLEFGFDFDSNSPVLNKFIYRIYSKTGKFIKKGFFEKNKLGPIYATEILKLINFKNNYDIGSILFSPDWLKHNLNPIGKGPLGNLIIRNTLTQDKDVTEFQSCWRNNQILIKDFPHWLYPGKMLIGGSKLYCGFCGVNKKSQIFLSLLNGSGNLKFSNTADVKICLINKEGLMIEKFVTIEPFVCKVINVNKLFNNFQKHILDNFGTIVVISNGSDLNGNLITKDRDSVTLQHMWGY